MNVVLVTVMLEFFLLAMTMNEDFRKMTPGQWMPMAMAIVGPAGRLNASSCEP